MRISDWSSDVCSSDLAMRRQRNAKILATLGPASSSKEMIRQLFRAGADVFRLNFSHGSHDDHRERYETIRAIEDELERPIGIQLGRASWRERVCQYV